VDLPADYLDAGHLTHGYALTAHKAQGLTCDATFVLGSDEIYREWGYVALSRGRTDNRLYLVGHDRDHDPVDDPTHPEVHQHDPRTPAERLTADLHRSHQQTLALDHQPDSSARTDAPEVGRLGRAPDAALGPRPADPDRQQLWDTAAAAIDTYRQQHAIHDERQPLGAVPADPAARDAYQQAVRGLLAARRALRVPPAELSLTPRRDVGRDVA
jgi:hypothetical protein